MKRSACMRPLLISMNLGTAELASSCEEDLSGVLISDLFTPRQALRMFQGKSNAAVISSEQIYSRWARTSVSEGRFHELDRSPEHLPRSSSHN